MLTFAIVVNQVSSQTAHKQKWIYIFLKRQLFVESNRSLTGTAVHFSIAYLAGIFFGSTFVKFVIVLHGFEAVEARAYILYVTELDFVYFKLACSLRR